MIRKSPLFYALCLNLFFFLLYVAFGQIRHGSLDDYFMSSVLTGAYGSQYDVHMYFIKAVYGYFLKPFYMLFPKVGWYFIFELVGTFTAFTIIAYFIVLKLGARFGSALAFLLLASFTPDFYFQLSFTQCATLYTATGILLFYFGGMERNKLWLVLSVLFLFAGSVMRHDGFLLGMPFLGLLFVLQIINKSKISWVALVTLCVAMVAIWGNRTYDRNLYVEGDYQYYAKYQPVRAYFGDGSFYDKESTYDELEERGMNGVNLSMARSWFFYDTQVLHADTLRAMREVGERNRYLINYTRFPIAFLLAVSKALTRTNGWCWVIFCLLLIATPSWKSNVYPWVSLSFIAVSLGYLLWVNRLVYHVETGVWVYAVVSAIPFIEKDVLSYTSIMKKWNRPLPWACLFFSLVFLCFSISGQAFKKQHLCIIDAPEMTKDWEAFVKYADDHPDDVFMLSFERYKQLGTFKDPAYKAIPPGSWQNIYSWGYWNMNLPSMKKELEHRGVRNPLQDVVNDNVYVMEDETPLLPMFYSEHYQKILHVDTAKIFGNLVLVKYRIKDF